MEKQWKWVKKSPNTISEPQPTNSVFAANAMTTTTPTGPRESPTDVINEIGSWYSVWLMAIARSWNDPAFKQRLLANPRLTLETDLLYTFPSDQDILLTIRDATGVDGSGFTNVGGNGVWKVPPTQVTLWLPPKPDRLEDQQVALASYQFTSQTYPFTCCC
jgi:ribosomally synthesized peptide (two-chain TOMM family)